MRATIMYGAGDVRVETVPDPALQQPTDAIVRVVRACVCGSDLHPYHNMPATPGGSPMGHEFVGVVEETGREVSTLKKGDFVIAPFAWSDGTCDFCREGLQTSCRHGGFWAGNGIGGGQAEAIRVPLADGTLVKAPVGEDSELLPSLLTLSDVFGTGYHAAVKGGVNQRTTVTVIGDGAVGLMAVLSAKRLGAERIILMGRHKTRTDLGLEFGATDVVAERGDEGIEKVRELTGRRHSCRPRSGRSHACLRAVARSCPTGRRHQPSRGTPIRRSSNRIRDTLRTQHHTHRWTGPGARVHRRADAGCAR